MISIEFENIRFWITWSFGRNPNIGGTPAKESSSIAIIALCVFGRDVVFEWDFS